MRTHEETTFCLHRRERENERQSLKWMSNAKAIIIPSEECVSYSSGMYIFSSWRKTTFSILPSSSVQHSVRIPDWHRGYYTHWCVGNGTICTWKDCSYGMSKMPNNDDSTAHFQEKVHFSYHNVVSSEVWIIFNFAMRSDVPYIKSLA